MNLQTLATDNITELLLKIIEFTQNRQEIIIQNIKSAHNCNFVPKDMPVEEFSNLMNIALFEHALNQRLLLCDGRHIKFGANGTIEITPVIDAQGKLLLEKDRNGFLRAQITKLMENTLNQKIATEMLRQKQSQNTRLGRRLN
ncbi:MAG: hypothetical protein JW749_09920 [Sedimentisphaerales bacterium]|nr:hypothetical protein [Sedimentisphaerales bacterium]